MGRRAPIHSGNKHLLISPHFRTQVLADALVGDCYTLSPRAYDNLPLDTFLVSSHVGTGGAPGKVFRIVRPNWPASYPDMCLTPGKRLIFGFWRSGDGIRRFPRGVAIKVLRDVETASFAHIILPGEPGHETMTAFKILCDTKRAFANGPVPVDTTLMYRAIEQNAPTRTGFDLSVTSPSL